MDKSGHGVSSPALTMEALGQSEAFLDFQERLSRVAPVDRPVLLIGERGTGKELAASRLHFLSRRWQGPLVALNCAALTPSLLEAELFGHEKGAFTGATRRRTGRFEAADSGALFLDEIGAIPMEVQEKILRVVEYGSFERVGGTEPIEVDVRIIGATNADLPRMADQGLFKRDLLDRLSFEVLFLPPLREREGDVLLLANHFSIRMAYELGWEETPEFSPGAVEALEGYAWEGNVRQLKNVVERAIYRSDDALITEIVFDPFQSPYAGPAPGAPPAAEPPEPSGPPPAPGPERPGPIPSVFTDQPLKDAVRSLEIHRLKEALESTKYNQKKAADLLGLTYDQFRGLHRKYAGELGD
ncbi:MAG: phage shock protein operon transcriptional activator [Desulfobacterales bacterium]|nr:phage shock protein operon transcriptional activator [Desulfobacterales bacterium]